MNKSRSDNTAPKPIQAEDVLRNLTAGVGQLDGDRAAGYSELSTLRSAKQSSLARREKIYAVKYGATDHRVLQTQKLQENNTRLRQEIYIAHAQAATPAPTVDDNGYVFHGFVRDCERRPLSRLTVALYDEKGQWLRELGYGCTDENGYFILRFARDAKASPEGQKIAVTAAAAQSAPAKESPETTSGSGEKVTGTTPPLRSANPADAGAKSRLEKARVDDSESRGRTAEVRVYDAKQTLLHCEAKPVTPRLGQVDYRVITINECGGRCVPPPGSTDDPPPPAPASPTQAPRVPTPTAAQPAPAAVAPPPAPAPPAPSTPLENIKGVGPITAARLRAAGIKDLEGLKGTETEKLIEFAGTDKRLTKPTPRTTTRRPNAARKKPKS